MCFSKKLARLFEKLQLAIYFSYPLGRLTTNLISLLTGFFLATVLATLPSQTGDWGVVAGGICNVSFVNNYII
nr:Ycf20 [Erythrotrichia carnea]